MPSKAPINPPFRADHVGSLLRPPELLRTREEHAAGRLTNAELHRMEDEAIAQAVAFQERVGLQAITDGEYRRRIFYTGFYDGLGGVTIDANLPPNPEWFFVDRTGDRVAIPVFRVSGRLKWHGPIHVDEFRQLSSLTTRMVKMTLPSPTFVHMRGGRDNISRDVYPDLDSFWSDLTEALRNEVRALYDAGCRYVQIDETAIANLADLHAQEQLKRRGENWRGALALYTDVLNRAFERPAGMHLAIHLCRGNFRSHWTAEGGYDLVADTLFNRVNADSYFLEYDTPRAGSFEPLRFVPANKTIVLGLVSTKFPELEAKEVLKRRIEEASRYVDLNRLCLSPQCGFASVDKGNQITAADQEAKLRLVIEVAHEVWGS